MQLDGPAYRLASAPQLGQLLKTARKARKLTQRAVAVRVGLSQNRLSYLELHPDDISVKQLLAWSATVGLELSLSERAPAAAATSDMAW